MRIVVTGASGFIGSAVCETLDAFGHDVWRVVRNPNTVAHKHRQKTVVCADIATDAAALTLPPRIDVVVHCAGHVPTQGETPTVANSHHRKTNISGTEQMAHLCVRAGIRRMVFMSSAKVHGEVSAPLQTISEQSPLQPIGSYANSKVVAEGFLSKCHAANGLEVITIRPPVVYGPGVRGNMLRLLKMVQRGLPLPLGSVQNSRSYISIDNIADFTHRCAVSTRISHGAFLVSDGTDISTPDLIRVLAKLLGRPTRLFPVPVPLIYGLTAMIGAQKEFAQIARSFRVNSSLAKLKLGWTPPESTYYGLEKMCAWFRKQK